MGGGEVLLRSGPPPKGATGVISKSRYRVGLPWLRFLTIACCRSSCSVIQPDRSLGEVDNRFVRDTVRVL